MGAMCAVGGGKLIPFQTACIGFALQLPGGKGLGAMRAKVDGLEFQGLVFLCMCVMLLFYVG